MTEQTEKEQESRARIPRLEAENERLRNDNEALRREAIRLDGELCITKRVIKAHLKAILGDD